MTHPADATLYGLHDGLLALAWLAGAALPVAGAALILAAAVVAARGARRRVTSARLHRAARRAGRHTIIVPEHGPELQRIPTGARILDGSEPILPPRS